MNRWLLVLVASIVVIGLGVNAEASIFVTGNVPVQGVQSWSGPLGDDFTVGSSDLLVTQIGVFDANKDGLKSTITAYIYPLGGGIPLATWTFPANTTLSNGTSFVWHTLATPLTLTAGTAYTLVAEGYSSLENNANDNITSTITFSQDGYILGNGRYGSTAGAYPTVIDTTIPYYHFGVANIQYSVVPEPATILVWSLLGMTWFGGLTIVRRRRHAWSPEARQAIFALIERGRK